MEVVSCTCFCWAATGRRFFLLEGSPVCHNSLWIPSPCPEDSSPISGQAPVSAHIFMNSPSLISVITHFSVPAVSSQGSELPRVLGLVTVLICISCLQKNSFEEIQFPYHIILTHPSKECVTRLKIQLSGRVVFKHT